MRPALLTLLADVAKGIVPTLLARLLLSDACLVAVVGLAAFFGHIFPVFLRFSGGKGVVRNRIKLIIDSQMVISLMRLRRKV